MRAAAFLLLFLFQNCTVYGQAGWGLKAYRSFVLPHNVAMTEMMSSSTAIEAGRFWRVDSGGRVDAIQHHPTVGLSVHYFQLGKDLNGNSIGINASYDAGVPMGKRSSLRARLAVGAGYLTQQFDIYNNAKNRAIGSHINGFMQVMGYVQTPIADQWQLQLGLGLSHYSNGNWSMPNLGINLPGLMFGINRTDARNRFVKFKQPRGERVVWEFGTRTGRRQMSIDDPRNIAVYLMEFSGNYPHNEFRGWRGGINVFFDRTYLFEKFQPLPMNYKMGRVTELALTVGHEYRINRVGFVADMGFYLYRPNDSKRKYYEAIGLKWYVSDHIILMNRLKAHLTSADYFEWGISYVFSGHQSQPGIRNMFKWLFSGMKPVR